MKRRLSLNLSIFLIAIVFSCKESNVSYYFYNPEDGKLKKDTLGTILSYSIIMPVYSSWSDSIKIEISNRGYFLMHHFKDEGEYAQDLYYLKPRSFLDSVEYIESTWFLDNGNLQNFWNSSQYINDGASDSLKIYIIEDMKGSDSLIIRRVHRFFMPGREG